MDFLEIENSGINMNRLARYIKERQEDGSVVVTLVLGDDRMKLDCELSRAFLDFVATHYQVWTLEPKPPTVSRGMVEPAVFVEPNDGE